MNTKKESALKRKVLFSLLFDVGTLDYEYAIVTGYHYLEDDTFNVSVHSGFVKLDQYHENIPIEKIRNLNSKKKILESCRYAIDEVLPKYSGKKVLSDMYYSPHLFAVHFAYGIKIENESMPK